MNRKVRAFLILAAAAIPMHVGATDPASAGPGLAGARVAQAQPAVVEVRIRGNTRMSEGSILAHVKTRVGHPYDAAVARGDQQRLLATGHFRNVMVGKIETAGGIIVTFQVDERPTIASVTFEGNKTFKDEHLRAALTFGVGGPRQRYHVEKGRQDIRDKYRKKGFFFVEISFDDKAFTKDGAVIYRIVEGPQVRVRKIRVEGNEYFSRWRLRQEIATSAWLWPLVAGYMDAEQLERDVHKIRNLYVQEGFLDAEVGRNLEFNDDKTRATLTFVIEEGPRYRIGRVVFEGNKVFSDEELAERIGLAPGDFYASLAVRRDTRKLQDTYGELGYIEATVGAARRFKDEPGQVDLVFTVRESDQYRVGKVIIRGNSLTQSRVVRRQLTFYPEQLFNMVAVRKSEQRLMESRLFSEASITPIGGDPGIRDALVQIQEGHTAEFVVGVGVSSQSGLLGSISLAQRNFDIMGWPSSWRDIAEGRAWKGAGQTLRISAEPGTSMMRFHVDWSEPYLFDRPYSLGAQVFLFTRDYDDYLATRYGAQVSVGHYFKSRWYGEVTARAEGIEIGDLDSTAPPEARSVAGTHGVVSLAGSMTRNRTDSRWLPSTGDVLRFGYEQVMGDFNFGKITAEYRIYRTLYVDALDRKHILSGRAAIGQIVGDAPLFEKFYGGGVGSIRGFKFRGISPRSIGTDDAVGGDFRAFVGTEYTFPLVSEVLRGVVFLDSGTVEKDFGVSTWRASAGVGVRWSIPFLGPVPISFDFGFPINRNSADDTEIFSFTIGWIF